MTLLHVLTPVPSAADRLARWTANGLVDLAEVYLDPVWCSQFPHAVAVARQAVLMAAYDGDYHMDVCDVDRLAGHVASGQERIFFWGKPDAIAKAKRLFLEGITDPERYEGLALGTASFLQRTDLGYKPLWELSRTGSISLTVGALAPNLAAIQGIFASHPEIDKLIATPRNRPPEVGVRSGIAIHRLHQREIGSTFLGFAPWYIMPKGAIELLDYREILSNPDHRPQKVMVGPGALEQYELRFLQAVLSQFGLGPDGNPTVSLCEDAPAAGAPAWKVVTVDGGQGNQPAFVSTIAKSCGDDLRQSLDTAARQGPACVVARLSAGRLDAGLAAILRRSGFALCALETPPSAGEDWIVSWARPRPGAPIRAPYYAALHLPDPQERCVAEYVTGPLSTAWSGLSAPHLL